MNREGPAPEWLRAAALEELGHFADPRTRAALEGATLIVEADVGRWEGSAGPVRAHRSLVGLSAAQLGVLLVVPALVDELQTALARAVARRPGETLMSMQTFWDGRLESTGAPYRASTAAHSSLGDPAAMQEGLVVLLRAAGRADLATLVAGGALTHVAQQRGRVAVLALTGDDFRALAVSLSDKDLLARAACSLLTEPGDMPVVFQVCRAR